MKIGIDFGTSNSAAAAVVDGRVVLAGQSFRWASDFGARAAFKLYLKEVKSVEEATQLREILDVALDGSGQAFAVRAKDGTVVFENELYSQVKPALRN